MTLGEHPPFSPEELRLMRQRRLRDLWAEWNELHVAKNGSSDRAERDRMTERMCAIEEQMETLRDPRVGSRGSGLDGGLE